MIEILIESLLALFYIAVAYGAYHVGGSEGVLVFGFALLLYISHKVAALQHSVGNLAHKER